VATYGAPPPESKEPERPIPPSLADRLDRQTDYYYDRIEARKTRYLVNLLSIPILFLAMVISQVWLSKSALQQIDQKAREAAVEGKAQGR
jgi:hypothetical protein